MLLRKEGFALASGASSSSGLLSFSVLTTDPHQLITRKDFISFFAVLTFTVFVYYDSFNLFMGFQLTLHLFTSGRLKTGNVTY